MAVSYGFFDSVGGDRKYSAAEMSQFYDSVITEGVFQNFKGGLAVSAGTGLSVSVAAGRANLQSRWLLNDAALTLSIDAASTTYGRIDAVVMRLSESSRNISIVVKKGTPASSPVAPSLTRSGGTYEMALAYVTVAANASSVSVTDKRSDSSLCGWAAVRQSVPGEIDAMLEAMKTGFDGGTYDSPAAMVRGSDQKLQDQIDETFVELSKATVGYQPLKTIKDSRISMGGVIVANATGYTRTDYIDCSEVKELVFHDTNAAVTQTACFYTSGKEFLSRFDIFQNKTTIVPVPETAKYFIYSDTNEKFAKITLDGFYEQFLDEKYVKFGSVNMFDKTNVEENVQIVGATGQTVARDDRDASWFIPVKGNTYYMISNQIQQLISHCAFYNGTQTYISGVEPGNTVVGRMIVKSPANARYIRFTIYKNALDSAALTEGAVPVPYSAYDPKTVERAELPIIKTNDVVTVGASNCDYTSILAALKGTAESVKIRVTKGTYNIVNEYKAIYGNDFFDNYTGYAGNIDYFYRGYSLGYGREMDFEAGAVVVYDYDGNNQNVIDNFSPFNTSYDSRITGLYLIFGENKCRYAIHDDFGYWAGTNIIENCIFDGTPSAASVIGGGMGQDNVYIIRNCIFKNNDAAYDITYHNYVGSGAINRIYVDNCFGKQGCWFRWFGASDEVSDVIVSNSRFKSIGVQAHSATPHDKENVRLTEFNNTLYTE